MLNTKNLAELEQAQNEIVRKFNGTLNECINGH